MTAEDIQREKEYITKGRIERKSTGQRDKNADKNAKRRRSNTREDSDADRRRDRRGNVRLSPSELQNRDGAKENKLVELLPCIKWRFACEVGSISQLLSN